MNKVRNNGTPQNGNGINGATMPGANGGGEMGNTAMPRVGSMSETALLERLRALSFVKTELELYLDTHPECPAALDYYRRTVDELGELMEQYQMSYGPLIAAGGANVGGWDWVKYPWPWQRGDEKMWNKGTRGGA